MYTSLVKYKRGMFMLNNKGAMFGLDARIALAIFGALSVISGAALYSAIQESRTVSLLASLNEVSKAIEQYMLDTGADLVKGHSSSRFDMESLVKDLSIVGWNGPYLSYGNSTDANLYLEDGLPVGERLGSRYATDDDFPTATDIVVCTTGKPCYVWILLHNAPEDLVKQLDLKVDGVEGALTGNLRYHLTGSLRHIYFKGPLLLEKF